MNIESPAGRVRLIHFLFAFSVLFFSAALSAFIFLEPQENDPGLLFKIGTLSFFFIVSVLSGIAAKFSKREQWKEYERKLKDVGNIANIEEHIKKEKAEHTRIITPYLFFPPCAFLLVGISALF